MKPSSVKWCTAVAVWRIFSSCRTYRSVRMIQTLGKHGLSRQKHTEESPAAPSEREAWSRAGATSRQSGICSQLSVRRGSVTLAQSAASHRCYTHSSSWNPLSELKGRIRDFSFLDLHIFIFDRSAPHSVMFSSTRIKWRDLNTVGILWIYQAAKLHISPVVWKSSHKQFPSTSF